MTDPSQRLAALALPVVAALLLLGQPLAAQQQGFPPRDWQEDDFERETGETCNLPPSSSTPSEDGVVYWDDLCDFTLGTMRGYEFLPPENIDWLGAGFDIVHVDPARFGSSRGRKRNPINLVISGTRTWDGDYYLIHGTEYFSGGATESNDAVHSVTSVSSYRKAFEVDVSAGLDLAGIAAFAGSASYAKANDRQLGSEKLWMIERRDSAIHTVTLLSTWTDERTGKRHRHRLNPDFRRAVNAIRGAPSDDWRPPPIENRPRISDWCQQWGYAGLIEEFGTHYSRRVTFGGQFNTETEIDRSEFLRSEKTESAFKAEVKGQIRKIGGSLGGGYRSEVESSRGGSNERQSVRHWHTGGSPSQNYETWAASLKSNPVPVRISFAPITELVSSLYFPEDPRIRNKQKALRACIEDRFVPYQGLDISASGEDFWRAPPAPVWQDRTYRVSFKEIRSTAGPLKSYQIYAGANAYHANQSVHDECRGTRNSGWWHGPDFFVEDGDFPRQWEVAGRDISRWGSVSGASHLEIRNPADLDSYVAVGACISVFYIQGGLDRTFGIESSQRVYLEGIAVNETVTGVATAYHPQGDEILLEVAVKRVR